MKKDEIEIRVTSLKDGLIPFNDVIGYINGIQQMVYSIAEMKAHLSPSKPGPKSKELKSICDLMIRKVEPGSIVFHVIAREPAINLFGRDNFGTEVLKTSAKLLELMAMQDTDAINELTPEPEYRNKIVGNAQNFIPRQNAETSLEIRSENGHVTISKLDKSALEEIISENKQTKKIYHTKFADIKGEAVFDEDDEFMEIKYVFEVNDLDGFLLNKIKGKNYEYELTKSLFFEVVSEKDLQIITQKDLDIITYCQKGEEINDVIGTEFDIIWNEYVEAEEGTLHSSGLKLKDTFTKLIHRRKITA